MRRAVLLSLLLASCAPFAPRASAPASGSWSRRFPELARRVPGFDQRLGSADAETRLAVITELTCFHPRDSRRYPALLRALLADGSPKVRWEAAWRLREHGVFLTPAELPASMEIPLVGLYGPGDPASAAAVQEAAGEASPRGGWALCALAMAKDPYAAFAARALQDAPNPFVRFAAATALLELGRDEEAAGALAALVAAQDDPSGFYRMRAAETLVRAGRAEYLEPLLDAACARNREQGSDDGLEILADLTGRRLPTAAEWRAWWREKKAGR